MKPEPLTHLSIDGKEIILVGTAHVSEQSAILVRRVIEEELPNSVCIELDPKRYDTIQNPRRWEETDLIQIIRKKQTGFMLANLALGAYQKRIADKLGVKVGSEMLQGIASAKEIGAEIVLADREVQVTFQRIWRKLGLWERTKLLSSLLFSFDDEADVKESDLEELLQEDMLESVLHEVKGAFPKIGSILIDERDLYLAHHIRNAPGEKVVAVLGAAHVPGVTKALQAPPAPSIAPLTEVPPGSKALRLVGYAIPLAILGLLIYSFTNGMEAGLSQLLNWVLWNGSLSALCTLLVLGHPLSILTSFVVAPISSLNPFLAAGWFSGLVQAFVQKPTVEDLQGIQTDILSIKGFLKNKALRVLLVVMFANIGSTLGTFLGGADLIQTLF